MSAPSHMDQITVPADKEELRFFIFNFDIIIHIFSSLLSSNHPYIRSPSNTWPPFPLIAATHLCVYVFKYCPARIMLLVCMFLGDHLLLVSKLHVLPQGRQFPQFFVVAHSSWSRIEVTWSFLHPLRHISSNL